MGTSKYFKNYSPERTNEQRLMEDLINEAIRINGEDIYYVPRGSEGDGPMDQIFGEQADSRFERAYKVEMYIQTTGPFEGEQNIYSKFGYESRDNAHFVVPRRAFERYVPASIRPRPYEGDLLYVPVMKAFFEIKFVEEEKEFFSLGKRYPFTYYLSCERFRFSNENIETGVGEIDVNEPTISYTIELALGAGANSYNIGETVYQGTSLGAATVTAEVADWDNANNKLMIINVNGKFSDNTTVIGATTNTRYTLTSSRDQGDFIYYGQFDNETIQTEAEEVIDSAEINPFGSP